MEIDINITEWAARFLKPFGEIETCDICGDYHESDSIPLSCHSGDGE